MLASKYEAHHKLRQENEILRQEGIPRRLNVDTSIARYCSLCRESLLFALNVPAVVLLTSVEPRTDILRMELNFLSNAPTTEDSRRTFARMPTIQSSIVSLSTWSLHFITKPLIDYGFLEIVGSDDAGFWQEQTDLAASQQTRDHRLHSPY